jgi:hypothetical protein
MVVEIVTNKNKVLYCGHVLNHEITNYILYMYFRRFVIIGSKFLLKITKTSFVMNIKPEAKYVFIFICVKPSKHNRYVETWLQEVFI